MFAHSNLRVLLEHFDLLLSHLQPTYGTTGRAGVPQQSGVKFPHRRWLVVPDVSPSEASGVRADLGSHLKYSRRWSGVRAGVLLGAQGAVHRGESRGGL